MAIETNSDQLSIYINQILAAADEHEISAIISEAGQTFVSEQFALVVEAIPAETRLLVWHTFSEETKLEVFIDLGSDTRKWLIKALDDVDCFQLLEQLDADDLLEIAEEIPDRFLTYAIKHLDTKQRALFDQAQQYDVEQIGHWLNYDYVRISNTLKVVSAKKLINKGLQPFTDEFYIVDKANDLVSVLNVNKLMSSSDESTLKEIVEESFITLNGNDNIYEAAEAVIISGKMSLPVVDDNNKFIGRVDIESAYQLRQEQIQEQMNLAGGLSEDEALFSSVMESSKNRGVWLGINLATAFLASWFIGLFEATLQEMVALAVLMPVVASMGGIAGSQTLTVIVRGLALGQITSANQKALLRKELKVGLVNGIIWSSVIGIITFLWFDNVMLSLTILLAILLNLIAAACSGVLIPSILNKMNIDPALSGSVVLTTVTDIVGFVVFLGLGSLVLL
ncbi:magnesium transporter [Colwellia sp. D2M02]|uniref:Magnesium transporter n=1 Tax=Colwellia asteriadis TaxID=517723 RepID=A0ABP3WCC1_9GAMM|nr:magnesium transporter [Colwellia sp. D2M02]